MTAQPTTTRDECEVIFDPETRDHALYFRGELVGFARSEDEGRVVLSEVAARQVARERAEAAAGDETLYCESCGRELAECDGFEADGLMVCGDCYAPAPPVVDAEHPAGFTPLPILAPESIENQCGRRFDLVEQHADGSATYRAPRARATLYLSDYAVKLMAEGRGVTIEELVDHRTGRTRLFSYRAA